MTQSKIDVRVGDLVEYQSFNAGGARTSYRGIVVAVAKSQDDLNMMGYDGMTLKSWPSVNPVFILVDDCVNFWCGNPNEIEVLSRFDATVG